MKFSLSALLALAAVMPVIASVPLKIPMVLTIVSDWDNGYVEVDDKPAVYINMPGDPISIDVNGSPQTYQRITEIPFENVDPDHKVKLSIGTKKKDQPVPSLESFDVAVVADPGVKFVHLIIDKDLHWKVNVYDKEVQTTDPYHG